MLVVVHLPSSNELNLLKNNFHARAISIMQEGELASKLIIEPLSMRLNYYCALLSPPLVLLEVPVVVALYQIPRFRFGTVVSK